MPLTVKEKFDTLIKLLLEPKVLYKLISFRSFGYLLQTGWFNSFKSGKAVSAELKPIPWFTYSAIDFLKDRLNNNLTILEFGSGNSTLFFSERVKYVLSLEHQNEWYQKLLNKKLKNVEPVLTSSLNADNYLQPLVNQSKFDLIIVDGLFRNDCMKRCLKFLSETGIVALDDSERNEYDEGINFLLKNDFKQIDFSGIAPGIFFRKCTTFFYKDRNCFGI